MLSFLIQTDGEISTLPS